MSISLVRKGETLLIDPGTFEYVGDSGERARLRGTGAHNTLQVDGRDQAEPAGPFSWKPSHRVHVEQWVTGHQFDLFQGSHDGYSRLSPPAIIAGAVFHRKGKFWLVRDLAEGQGSHQLEIAWHLGPTMSPASSKEYLFAGKEGSLALLAAEAHGWSQSVTRENWSPAYGCAERACVVTFGASVELPADFATLLLAGENLQADLGHLVRWNDARWNGARQGVCAYRYSEPHQEHAFFFAEKPGPWSLGKWASDADFLYFSFDREKEEYTLILCNGSYANAATLPLLTCGRRVSYAEVLSAAMKVEIFSSDPENIVLQQPLDRVWAETHLERAGRRSQGYGCVVMCGICGIFHSDRNQSVNRDALVSMNQQIVHRGPDDDGFFVEKNVGLAMRRLSIIDVQTGHQPISNEDESIWIVFNGEIYNHQELRNDLQARGHRYRTKSDTETIVHLYEEYGRDCVNHLRGMFAFAIWDRSKRSLFIARDRLGIKPLYYRYDGKTLLFGSEIKAILAYPGMKPEFNRGTFGRVSRFWLYCGRGNDVCRHSKIAPRPYPHCR